MILDGPERLTAALVRHRSYPQNEQGQGDEERGSYEKDYEDVFGVAFAHGFWFLSDGFAKMSSMKVAPRRVNVRGRGRT